MKKFSTIAKRTTSLLLSIVTILMFMTSVLTVNSSAASAKQTFDCDRTVTLNVRTGSKLTTPSIKFVCKAAKVPNHRCKRAPLMSISVSPAVNGKNFFLISGSGKEISSVLRLKRNTLYTIRLSYRICDANKCSFNTRAPGVHNQIGGGYSGYNGFDRYANGYWYISRTANCTIQNTRFK